MNTGVNLMKSNLIALGAYTMIGKTIVDRVYGMKNLHEKALRHTRTRNLALGASIGTAVGVAAGVLFAPRSGKETRDEISRRTEGAISSLRNNVEETKSRISSSLKDQGSRLRSAAEACAEAALQAVESDSTPSSGKKK
jgi:gas vesicle protein